MTSTGAIFSLLFIIITLAGTAIQVVLEPRNTSRLRITECLLIWSFGVIIGLGGIWGFIGHTFFADQVAASIGWGVGNPFQQEVGLANLGLGILGLLSVIRDGSFREATLISYTVFMAGAGIVHLIQIQDVHNMAENNAGLILYIDIIMPVLLIGLYLLNRHLARNESHPSLRR
ncbi:MAG TPA: DUF6790 family protein [Methanospirillum sp.]|nr:DUF6790 family protein [Methanospirillum sp.]